MVVPGASSNKSSTSTTSFSPLPLGLDARTGVVVLAVDGAGLRRVGVAVLLLVDCFVLPAAADPASLPPVVCAGRVALAGFLLVRCRPCGCVCRGERRERGARGVLDGPGPFALDEAPLEYRAFFGSWLLARRLFTGAGLPPRSAASQSIRPAALGSCELRLDCSAEA